MWSRVPPAMLALGVAGALTAQVRGVGNTPTQADALSLKTKVAGIAAFGEKPTTRPNRTTVTEDEVNAFLVFDGRDQLPIGVVEPSVSILGTGRVSARAMVDLDALKKQRPPKGLLDPMSLASGRLPVTARGVLKTADGMGKFELESATLANISIPKLFLQEIVSYYSRSPERPAGIALDDSFALPAHIREIQVEAGRAIVVQ